MKQKIEYNIINKTPLVEKLLKLESENKEFDKSSAKFESWSSIFKECLFEGSIQKVINKAMFAQGFKEDLDDLPFPEVEEEKDMNLFGIEKLEYDLRDLMTTLRREVINKNISGKVYFDSLKKAYDELDNIRIPGVKEDLEIDYSEEKFDREGKLIPEKEEEYFDEIPDDDFDWDEDKIEEALNNFTPDNSQVQQFMQNNSNMISENMGVVNQDPQSNGNQISSVADASVNHDDDFDLNF